MQGRSCRAFISRTHSRHNWRLPNLNSRCYCDCYQVAERVRERQVPLAKFLVTKQLTKRPEDYPDARNQPHVQVALRRRAAGLRNGTMQVRCDAA